MICHKIQDDLIGLYDRCWDSFGMCVLNFQQDQLRALVRKLKDDFCFDLLLDITAVDFPERQSRFEVVYHLYSSKYKCRIRLTTGVGEEGGRIATLTDWYGSAHYLEREVHEMYGLHFAGNNDLRPILLYEGFEGHPLRKDYPMDREQPLVEYRK